MWANSNQKRLYAMSVIFNLSVGSTTGGFTSLPIATLACHTNINYENRRNNILQTLDTLIFITTEKIFKNFFIIQNFL